MRFTSEPAEHFRFIRGSKRLHLSASKVRRGGSLRQMNRKEAAKTSLDWRFPASGWRKPRRG